jgi:hypothetical protein
MDDTSLFLPDGDRWVATGFARGPWDVRHCHGGPVSALLARAVEHADDGGVEWQVARLTVELTRPVPVDRPLGLATTVERPGRKVSLVAAVLTDDGVEVARVRGLRIRSTPIELPAGTVVPPDEPLPPPEQARLERATWADQGLTAFHRDACEHRVVRGSWAEPGPIELWIRLRVPVVPAESASGVQRVAAAADFGNGVSGALPYDRFVYINPDLTVHLLRPAVGEWVGMRTASHYGAAGAGLAESALYDTVGRLGRSVQSLFVDAR